MIELSSLLSLLRSERGAISPLYAVAILPLIVMAGVAFDYSRLVSMDSELQNAADQAALAAATQLNGHDGAMADAEDAARNYFVNETRAAAGSRPITSLAIEFYVAKFDDEGNVITDDSTRLEKDDDDDGLSDDDSKAEVVEVTVLNRRVRYALTPVMGRLFSGDVNAKAKAMLDQSTCDVAPMMYCIPKIDNDGDGVPDDKFGTDLSKGRGIKLRMMPQEYKNAPETYAFSPGNFGFLDIDYDTHGSPNRRLGINSAGTCIGGRVETDPGAIETEADSLNTRFDIRAQSSNSATCDLDSGDFCASLNVRQNVVWGENSANCNGRGNAQQARRFDPAGLPIESCLKNDTCIVTSGTTWDGATYMAQNHNGASLSTVGANPTRWDIYNWEIGANSRLDPVKFANPDYTGTGSQPRNLCSYPRPRPTPYNGPANDDKDRRVLTVAMVDCTGMNGRDVAKVLRWTDIFLLTSADSFGASPPGADKAFYAEVIGLARVPGGGSGFQKYGRGKAVLVQ